MGIKVTISFDGIDTVLGNLDVIGQKAEQGVIDQVALLARDTKAAWESATPVRTGRLRGGSSVPVADMSFTLNNGVYYYKFVNSGHMTARGWRTKRGYRLAKRRSHVEGRQMTEQAMQFVEDNALEYLSKFLDDV